MRYSDFNRCDEIARDVAQALRATGRKAIVTYGCYKPTTPFETWDERLQLTYKTTSIWVGFIHFWVECDNQIYDDAALQFGESKYLVLGADDSRYERFGIELRQGLHYHLKIKPKINWNFRDVSTI